MEEHKRDALEDFITSNLLLFEEEGPSEAVWSFVKDKTSRSQRVRRLPTWAMAAAAVGLLILGVGIGTMMVRPDSSTLDFAASSDLEELEQFYFQEVEVMVDQLVSNPDYVGIQRELEGIDADIEALKQELGAVPRNARQTVLQAIIASYETKVQLLENVMEYSKPFNERDEEGPTIM